MKGGMLLWLPCATKEKERQVKLAPGSRAVTGFRLQGAGDPATIKAEAVRAL